MSRLSRIRFRDYVIISLLVVLFLICNTALIDYRDMYTSQDSIVCLAVNLTGMAAVVVLYITLALEGRRDKSMLWMAVLVLLEFGLMFADFFSQYYEGYDYYEILFHLAVDLTFAIILLMCIVYWFYVKSILPEKTRLVRCVNVSMYVLLAIGILLLLANGKDGLYLTITGARYTETEFYPISLVFPTLMLMLNAVCIAKYVDNRRKKLGLAAVMPLVILGGVIDMSMKPDYGIIPISILFGLMLMYGNFYVYRSRDLAMKDVELVQQRADILVSQIQPHFLYNALTSIMNIKGNPVQTRDAISDFGKFLRGNLDTLTQKTAIPITKEADNTETYLLLEQLGLGDRLRYSIDLKDSGFMIPGMTLQALVQVCVEYGIKAGGSSGVIRISTDETEVSHLVKVDDDDNGFSLETLKKDESNADIIRNVRSRIMDMIGGDMWFKSTPGKGTHVMIIIPKAVTGQN